MLFIEREESTLFFLRGDSYWQRLLPFRFDSSVAPLIFADQFIKFSTRLSSPFLYGLGEHKQSLLLNVTNEWKRLSFWTRDVGPSPDTNLYG